MKYFQFNEKYLDMYSPGQDLNHLTNLSWEWRSYAVSTSPQNLERSINKIDIYIYIYIYIVIDFRTSMNNTGLLGAISCSLEQYWYWG